MLTNIAVTFENTSFLLSSETAKWGK